MRRGMNRGERATDRGTTSGDRMLGSSRLARLRCGLPLTRKKLRSLASMHQPYRRRAARHQASRRNEPEFRQCDVHEPRRAGDADVSKHRQANRDTDRGAKHHQGLPKAPHIVNLRHHLVAGTSAAANSSRGVTWSVMNRAPGSLLNSATQSSSRVVQGSELSIADQVR